MFYDISKFSNTSDYLPILVASLIVDIIVISYTLSSFATTKNLKLWYAKYTFGAVIADVLSVVIGLIITRFLYPYIFSEWNLWKFIILAVLVQITHDILFYWLFSSIPRGKSSIIDLFKNYAKELKGFAIFGDSLIIIGTILIASYLAGQTINTNLILLIIGLYIIPYLLYSF
jgi:uncharacterized protein YacL